MALNVLSNVQQRISSKVWFHVEKCNIKFNITLKCNKTVQLQFFSLNFYINYKLQVQRLKSVTNLV